MMLRFISLVCLLVVPTASFNLVMMGRRSGKKGNLKKTLNGESVSKKRRSASSTNQGKGQEITGVTLPANGAIKGWEFGEGKRMACANVDGKLYAVQGDCPRCGFDLWKGDLIFDDPGWEDLPRVACPTCATTFSFNSGEPGPPIKRSGLSAFVGKLANTATATEKFKNAEAFQITLDEDGRVYCRNKQSLS
jgi:nitrite reductase/ring-hydroxylating ferredoxin subunit